MNVAYLLSSFNRGGIEMLALQVFREIKKYDINITCVYKNKGQLYSQFSDTGVQLVCLNNKLKYIFQLRNLIKKNNIQVIHAHLFMEAFLAYWSIIGLRRKLIYTLHSYGRNEGYSMKKLKKFLLKRTTINLYVSNSVLNFYTKEYNLNKTKQQLLYNGTDLSRFARNQSLIAPRESEKGCLILGAVGNFTSVRDHKTICRFIKELDKARIDFKFFFIGAKSNSEPHLYQECIDFCKKNNLNKKTFFLGSRNDVHVLLKQMDAFIYSTVRDTFGIAVIEAMAAGVPVFVNDWEVMNEITCDGKYATVYKTEDENDLLNKFLYFISKKSEYKIQTTNATHYVLNKFSIENHRESLSNLYHSILT